MKRTGFRTAFLSTLLLVPMIVGGCGGGGGSAGGGPDPIESIPYAGQTTQASIAADNAATLMLGAYLGGVAGTALGDAVPMQDKANATGTEIGGGASGIDSYLAAVSSARRLLRAARASGVGTARAMAVDSWTEDGPCGGHADMSVDENASTGDFTGTINFVDYNDCEAVLSGEFRVSGHYDTQTFTVTRLSIAIYSFQITMVDSGETASMCGTISVETVPGGDTTRMNVRERDEATALVYWYRDYVITSSYAGSFNETLATGRFYDPGRGYVDLSTVTPLRTYWENNLWNDYPSEGTLSASGSGGTTASLKFLSKNVYRVEADTDGDGTFDFDGGRIHWPGANIAPVSDAGADRNGNVGCVTTLDGSGSGDGDGDAVTYYWTIVSAPFGSTAALSDNTAASPTFTPDVPGTYQFGLLVGDGFATAADSVTLAAGPDLFCASQAVLIPAATGYFPRSVAVGDLDNDGRDDVVMATWTSYTPAADFLYVFTQDASGGLSAPVAYPGGDGKAIAVGDLDGDGRNDIAVTLGNGVGILHQSASGGFEPMASIGYGEDVEIYDFHDVRIADVDNDGRKDLIALYNNFDNAVVNVFYQDAAGALAAPLKFATDYGEWELRIGDKNGDGLNDIVMYSNKRGTGGSVQFGNYVKVMLQNANRTLGSPADYLSDTPPFGIQPITFAAGDVTGDATQDLVISSLDSMAMTYSVGVFPQEADGTAGARVPFPAYDGVRQVEVVDVSGDSRNDVVAYHTLSSETAVTVYRQAQQGGLAPFEHYKLPFWNGNAFNHAFAVGDLNGDGFKDIAVATYITSESAGLVVVYGNTNRGAP